MTRCGPFHLTHPVILRFFSNQLRANNNCTDANFYMFRTPRLASSKVLNCKQPSLLKFSVSPGFPAVAATRPGFPRPPPRRALPCTGPTSGATPAAGTSVAVESQTVKKPKQTLLLSAAPAPALLHYSPQRRGRRGSAERRSGRQRGRRGLLSAAPSTRPGLGRSAWLRAGGTAAEEPGRGTEKPGRGTGEAHGNRYGRARRPLRPWRRPLEAGRGHLRAGAPGPSNPSRPSLTGNGSGGKGTEGKKITVRDSHGKKLASWQTVQTWEELLGPSRARRACRGLDKLQRWESPPV